jgi:hypothetical protein
MSPGARKNLLTYDACMACLPLCSLDVLLTPAYFSHGREVVSNNMNPVHFQSRFTVSYRYEERDDAKTRISRQPIETQRKSSFLAFVDDESSTHVRHRLDTAITHTIDRMPRILHTYKSLHL